MAGLDRRKQWRWLAGGLREVVAVSLVLLLRGLVQRAGRRRRVRQKCFALRCSCKPCHFSLSQ